MKCVRFIHVFRLKEFRLKKSSLYLHCVDLAGALVLTYDCWYRIFKFQVNPNLNKIAIHDYDYSRTSI